MSQREQHFPIPTMEFFGPKNPYTGSVGDFRYRIVFDGEKLQARTYETYCYEVAPTRSEGEFSPDEDGLAKLDGWLYEELSRYRREKAGDGGTRQE